MDRVQAKKLLKKWSECPHTDCGVNITKNSKEAFKCLCCRQNTKKKKTLYVFGCDIEYWR